jgi:GTP cyclohydrolase I
MLDGYAFRPQVQERLTIQVADAIERELSPLALGVVIRGRHTCQCVRGVRKDGRMMTSAMRGVFRESPEARAEFMAMITLSNGNGNLLH